MIPLPYYVIILPERERDTETAEAIRFAAMTPAERTAERVTRAAAKAKADALTRKVLLIGVPLFIALCAWACSLSYSWAS